MQQQQQHISMNLLDASIIVNKDKPPVLDEWSAIFDIANNHQAQKHMEEQKEKERRLKEEEAAKAKGISLMNVSKITTSHLKDFIHQEVSKSIFKILINILLLNRLC